MSGDWKQNIVHRKCAAIRGKLDNFFAGNFFVWYFRHLSNLFHNKYSHICFANMFLVKHFPASNFLIVINLINQFTIIYNYFLILLDQTKKTLSILLDNWVNRKKRNFSARRAVLSCMVLSILWNTSLSVQSILLIWLIVAFLYDLIWV